MTGLHIFVLDRGFVVIGETSFCKTMPLFFTLENSATIRRWGTTKGLSELQNGPIKGSTVLDDVCSRTVPFRAIIDIIHLTPQGEVAWRKELGITK